MGDMNTLILKGKSCDFGELKNKELGSPLSCLSCLHFYMHSALVPVSASHPWLIKNAVGYSLIMEHADIWSDLGVSEQSPEPEWGNRMAWLPAPLGR